MTKTNNLETIVTKYCHNFPEQLRGLAYLVSQACQKDEVNKAALLEAIHACHRIGGTAHCMGFRYIGAVFMKFETELMGIQSANHAQVDENLKVIESKLSRLYDLSFYVEPKNSVLLKKAGEEKPDNDDLKMDWLLAEQRIMIADDDASIRALVHSVLQDAGVGDVKVALSGQEVITKAREFSPTIIIADWMMQPMDGLEMLQAIRGGGTSLKYDIPVIFISALNQTRGIFKVIRNGADYFLLKPFTQNSLIKGITHVASRA